MTKAQNKDKHYPLVKKRYRSVEDRCVLKIRLCASEDQIRKLESTFYRVHLAKNELRVFIRKRLGQARKTRAWKRSRKAYHSAAEHQKKVKKNGKTWLVCQKEKEKAAAQMNAVLEHYGVISC